MKHKNTTHGMSKDPTYYSWKSMIQRCCNPNHDAYKNYGGRGIKVCRRWLSFDNFLHDMGSRPLGSQLNRVNNSKGYNLKNVKWETIKQNANNRRSNHFITINNVTKTISEWAEISGVNKTTIRNRIVRYSWDTEEAVFDTARLSRKNNR